MSVDKSPPDAPKVPQKPIEAFAPSIPPDAPIPYREFWRLWSEARYFECHEVLEDLWRETHGTQRLFYNGLIHGAVSIYQHRRGNCVGAARQLLRSQIKLEALRPSYFALDLDEFLRIVEIEIAPSLVQIEDCERARWPVLEAAIRARIARD